MAANSMMKSSILGMMKIEMTEWRMAMAMAMAMKLQRQYLVMSMS